MRRDRRGRAGIAHAAALLVRSVAATAAGVVAQSQDVTGVRDRLEYLNYRRFSTAARIVP
jgi:hypothetical protein